MLKMNHHLPSKLERFQNTTKKGSS